MKKASEIVNLFFVVSLFLSFLIIESNAEPRTIVVPDDYFSIQEAVDNATEGDTVFVRKGTYHGSVSINKSLFLVGEDAKTTVIIGDDYLLNGTIILISVDNVSLSNFTVKSNDQTKSRRGVHLLHAKYCTISDNIFTACNTGIWLYDSSQNVVQKNSVIDNMYGIKVELSFDNAVVKNSVVDCSYGIGIFSSECNRLRDNKIDECSNGFVHSSDDSTLFNNDVDFSNLINGKQIIYWINRSNQTVPTDVGHVTLVNCTGITVGGFKSDVNIDEILLLYTNKSKIINTSTLVHLRRSSGNIVTENRGAVLLEESCNNTISKNTLRFYNARISLTHSSSGNFISDNIITDGNGISLGQSCNHNTLTNNFLEHNHQGVYISTSFNNILTNNTLIENGNQFYVSSELSSSSSFINYIDTTNTINSKPIYYWVNRQNQAIPEDAAYVVLINCTNILVENLNSSSLYGVLLYWTTNSVITQNTVTKGDGIHLSYSSNNTISKNTVKSNDFGIFIFKSSNNIVDGNTFSNNIVSGVHLQDCEQNIVIENEINHNNPYGVCLKQQAKSNTVSGNHIESNVIGVFVENSFENVIVGNIITRNTDWGIQLTEDQCNNSIFHNSFIDNRQWQDGIQVSIPGIDESGEWNPGHENVWDNGEKGNYWSEYSLRYPNATEIDNSGTGNTPFFINPKNIDNYPLLEPIEPEVIPEFPSGLTLTFILVTLVTILLVIFVRKKFTLP